MSMKRESPDTMWEGGNWTGDRGCIVQGVAIGRPAEAPANPVVDLDLGHGAVPVVVSHPGGDRIPESVIADKFLPRSKFNFFSALFFLKEYKLRENL